MKASGILDAQNRENTVPDSAGYHGNGRALIAPPPGGL